VPPADGARGGAPRADDASWTPALRALAAAARRLASRGRPRAGGLELVAGPVATALDDAVWLPAPDRLAEAVRPVGEAPAVLAPPGDPVERPLRAAGYLPTLALILDDPFATGAGPAPGPDGGDVGWHASRDLAEVLLGADGDSEAVHALAATLASAAADDPAVRLQLAGAPGEPRAALVAVEDADSVIVLLAGGPAEPLAARTLAEGRALGKRALWARSSDADSDGAALVRWERPA
jgi:hypothetical protein